jgi:hypothetical protein
MSGTQLWYGHLWPSGGADGHKWPYYLGGAS